MSTTTDSETASVRLDRLRGSSKRQLTRSEVAEVLGIKPNSLDTLRIRHAKGTGGADVYAPDAQLGRTPLWSVAAVRKIIKHREAQ